MAAIVIIGTGWTDPDGITHRIGELVDTDDVTAASLARSGTARAATAEEKRAARDATEAAAAAQQAAADAEQASAKAPSKPARSGDKGE